MASATWVLSLASVLFSCAFAVSLPFSCPPKELIQPCSCYNGLVACKNIIGQDILDGVFRRLGNTKVTYFLLADSRIDYIPLSLIDNGVEAINIDDSTLSQLFERDLSARNELSVLMFKNVTILNNLFTASPIKPLQKLRTLGVRDMEVPLIGRGFSEITSQKLRSVYFDNTRTRSIDRAFSEKAELANIGMNRASLTTLKRSYFANPADNLFSLSFRSNQIETLPDDLFVSMKELRAVVLTDNKITQVSESVFGDVIDQLWMLYLRDNPIKCDCSIKWLTLRNIAAKDISGKCVEPQSLAGRDIADLKSSDFPDC